MKFYVVEVSRAGEAAVAECESLAAAVELFNARVQTFSVMSVQVQTEDFKPILTLAKPMPAAAMPGNGRGRGLGI